MSARADGPPDYDFQWANIGDLNNPPIPGHPPNDPTAGRGSVSYPYRISKLEITTQQWADFLNMALRQGVDLNNPRLRPAFWGASLSGNQYVVSDPLRPVIGLNWRAGAYYCNWLTNGKQESWTSALAGAYDSSTFGDLSDGTFTDQTFHSPGAKFWIPTLDEWEKAAHFDPNRFGPGQGGWWNYCYGSDSAPTPGPPPPGAGQTTAGYRPGGFAELLVPLGAYTNQTSKYGLWDLSGGSREWLEEAINLRNGRFTYRRADGSYAGDTSGTAFDHIQGIDGAEPFTEDFFGFRVAGEIPSPSVITVFIMSLTGLSYNGRRRDDPCHQRVLRDRDGRMLSLRRKGNDP